MSCLLRSTATGIAFAVASAVSTLALPAAAAADPFAKTAPWFEPNVGQAPSSVQFVARVAHRTVWLTATGLKWGHESGTRIEWIGAGDRSQFEAQDPRHARVSYLRGSDPSRWRRGIDMYGRVRVADLYPGVALTYYGAPDGGLEYDVEVSPFADIHRLAQHVAGADALQLDSDGSVVIRTGGEVVRQRRPRAYQIVAGSRRAVPAWYELDGPRDIRVKVGAYDRARPLVIDPVLAYSTYLGGSGTDYATDVAVVNGNAYVTGVTSSPDLPGAQGALAGSADAFVAKLGPDGNLVYLTYIGGSNDDLAQSIAVDATGHAYITGSTQSADFPTAHAYDPTYNQNEDVFVTKLSADGAALYYSTFLGTGNTYRGTAIAVDAAGSAYVAGYTAFDGFPIVNGFESTAPAGPNGFLTKFTPDGGALVYSTYVGGSAFDYAFGVAIDAAGRAYVVGMTWSTDFPVKNPIEPFHGTGAPDDFPDAFITVFSPAGDALVYSTYLGGSGFDEAVDVAVDAAGSAYVTGRTYSTDFPVMNPVQAAPINTAPDFMAFALGLAPDGSRLLFSTYLGGTADNIGNAIAVSGAGHVAVTGRVSLLVGFPVLDPLASSPTDPSTGGNAFVTELNASDGSLVYSTLYGGNSDETGDGIAFDDAENVVVVGRTDSADLPVVNAFQPTTGNESDAFIAKISPGGGAVVKISFHLAGPNFVLDATVRNVTLASVASQPIVLRIGERTVTIPAGSLVARGRGAYRFAGTVDGFTLKATLHRAARTRVQLHIVGRGDIPPTSPLPVTIVVAGAQGSTLVKRPVHRHRHDDHRHHDDELSTGAL